MSDSLQLLPWQTGVWEQLLLVRRRGSLPHALLLAGPVGLGKVLFARLLAQSLLCEQPDGEGLPCGRCRGCHLVQAETHPDLHWVEPDQESKSGEIRISAIREINQTEGLTAQAGGYKISVITPADRMNISSANALLKTLEEPPGAALLILISSRVHGLPATIRSRCQQFNFRIPAASQVNAWLGSRVPAEQVDLLLALSGGAPFAALALADSPLLGERVEILQQFLGVIKDQTDPVAIAEEWAQKDVGQLFNWISGWLVDMLRLQTGHSTPRLFNPDQSESLMKMTQRLDPRDLHRLWRDVCETSRLFTTSLNAQLILENLLIEWSKLK